MPERIQRQRTKGWRMPAGAVYVGRPTKWGNPFAVNEPIKPGTELWTYMARVVEPINDGLSHLRYSVITPLGREVAVCAFAYWLPEQPHLMCSLDELRGYDLACWCPFGDEPCHADVLLELANQEAS